MMCIRNLFLIPLAERERLDYLHSIETCQGAFHTIKRENVFDDVIEMYTSNTLIAKGFPIRIKFTGECAIDAEGVARGMLSMFWESTYLKLFDGGALLIPDVHHQVAMENFPPLGAIISHGYLACGILPARIAFPILATCLLGPSTKICDKIIIESFINFLFWHDGEVLKEAFIAVRNVPLNEFCTTGYIT